MSIADAKKTYLQVLQESDGSLACYPFVSTNATAKVEYLDYENKAKGWMHVACSVSQERMHVRGIMLQSGDEMSYF